MTNLNFSNIFASLSITKLVEKLYSLSLMMKFIDATKIFANALSLTTSFQVLCSLRKIRNPLSLFSSL